MCLRRGKISIWGVRSADSVERFPTSSNSSKGNTMYVKLGHFAKCGFFFCPRRKKIPTVITILPLGQNIQGKE